jgi:hypothetical protein
MNQPVTACDLGMRRWRNLDPTFRKENKTMNTYKSSNAMAMVAIALGFAIYLTQTDQMMRSAHIAIAVPLSLVVGTVIESIRQTLRSR